MHALAQGTKQAEIPALVELTPGCGEADHKQIAKPTGGQWSVVGMAKFSGLFSPNLASRDFVSFVHRVLVMPGTVPGNK